MTVIAILKLVGMVVYPIVEYFLGKTSQGSVVGMILTVISNVLQSIGVLSSKRKGE